MSEILRVERYKKSHIAFPQPLAKLFTISETELLRRLGGNFNNKHHKNTPVVKVELQKADEEFSAMLADTNVE